MLLKTVSFRFAAAAESVARPDDWTDSSQPLGRLPTTATPRPVTSTTLRSAANMSHCDQHGNATHADDDAASARSVNHDDWSLSTGVRPPVGDQGPSPRGTQPRSGTGGTWYFLPSVGAGGYRYIPSSPDSQPQSRAPAWLLEMLATLNHDDMVSSKSASHETEPPKLSGGSHLVTSQSDIEPRSHLDPPAHDNMTVSTHDDKVSDPGWGIKVTTDGLELKFETQLKGLIRWLALVAWPVIVFSLLANVVLVLALLILVCSCCSNRKKYRKLKKKFYIRLPPPQLLPHDRSFMPPPTTGQDQGRSGSGARATM